MKQIGSHGPDVTDKVHPEIAAAAVRAARTVGLDIAGIDMVARDIGLPFAEQGAKICEVNAGPQLLIHAIPPSGPGRPIGEAIIAELFRADETGRIPIAAIAGRSGTRTAVLLEGILRAAGGTPGLTCGAGKWVAGWRFSAESHATSEAARDLLMSPEIDAAVFEIDWQSVASRGLPVDRWNTLVLLASAAGDATAALAPAADAPLEAIGAMIRILDPAGTIVVLDSERDLVALARRDGRAVITVATGETPAALPATDRRVAVHGGQIVHEHDGVADQILAVAELPAADAADQQPVLAAVAAAIGLGVPRAAIRAGLTAARQPTGG